MSYPNERQGSNGPVIGVVGLGAMGGQIAGRLLSQGTVVYGTNRTRAKADALIDRGLRWRDTPKQVTQAADVTISMVTDGDALQAVTAGPEGILAGLQPGKIFVEMSTISPASSGELARRVAAGGADMLTAPVSGSVPAVAAGTLAIMVGGNPDA
jgi:3-hydroxyisobutyrate dehydrogenase-like beta-hydroxyacid dehydrogenase